MTMTTPSIRFDDGAAYERYMGKWSQLAGETFLDWLAPATGWRWLDVGCGSGAFTEMIVARCAPSAVDGIDPSEAQLAYARTRRALSGVAQFREGNAMALPFANDSFDAAVMPLVIFFVPEPAVGVAEKARGVRPGGLVAAYAWDMEGGGFPYHTLHSELRAFGVAAPRETRPEASRRDVMEELWSAAGLVDVETCEITVHRTFADFDDYWTTVLGAPSAGATLATMSTEQRAELAERIRARLPADKTGRITTSARANAVRGRVAR